MGCSKVDMIGSEGIAKPSVTDGNASSLGYAVEPPVDATPVLLNAQSQWSMCHWCRSPLNDNSTVYMGLDLDSALNDAELLR
eukprot:CAMPEP_0182811628 /NCGR_PEP_ID=MMETSP0006_2-20121128/8374_1 /TAXON_ID=97485 /ORGANISM="Prymnesium parvum, Strain Texoma1" /LENGTH=81 /DNA_ID=CAMNT_0024937603 /DNA_START=339 /DNA_END=585 /DNA_ORIENTATION=-